MKSLTIVAGVALVFLPAQGADGASIAVGNPLAAECYEAALSRNDSPTALSMCDRALDDEALHRADRASTLVNRGILSMLRGRTVEAEDDFDRAMALDPRASDPPLNMGLLRLRQGRPEEALALFERAIASRDRQEAMIYYARGLAHEQAGDVRAAYNDLVKARALSPGWDKPAQELARYTVRR